MRLITASLLGLLMAASAHAEQAPPDLKLISARYVEAQEAVYRQGAGSAQIEALMNFYAPSYTYYHPQFGAKVVGLENVRRGTSSHLGELAEADIQIDGMLVNGATVSLALHEKFVDANGQRTERPRTTVLTFKGEKIVQRIDI